MTIRPPLATAISLLLLAGGQTALAGGSSARAQHIILFIGDGMNVEHEIATSRYLYGDDFALSFQQLPYQASVATWDVSTYEYWSGGAYDPDALRPRFGYDPTLGGKLPYPLAAEANGAKDYLIAAATDSASAATAWATGYKTDAGNIAWLADDPEEGALETIAETFRKDLGYAIGVVSTVPFSHATPAAHVSHNVNRNNYAEIATEILTEVKPDVVIGGGYPAGSSCDAPASSSYIPDTAYAAVCDDPDYVVATRAAGADGGLSLLGAAQEAAADGKKLFGLYGGENGNFESFEPHDLPGTPDVKQATQENPSLTEATLAALKVLSQDDDGFFVMVEQGDIDWANHANDFQRMVGTTKDLDDAVKAAMDFVDQPGDAIDWSNTLLIVTSDHSNSYLRNVAQLGAGDLPTQVGIGSCGYGGDACTYPDGDVTYGSTGHTNELVRLYAAGAGVESFQQYEGRWYKGTRIIDNTQMYHVMRDAAGISTQPYQRLAKRSGN